MPMENFELSFAYGSFQSERESEVCIKTLDHVTYIQVRLESETDLLTNK